MNSGDILIARGVRKTYTLGASRLEVLRGIDLRVRRGEALVIIAERAAGTSRADPAAALDAIRAAVSDKHGVAVTEARLVSAGAIPRTTSGKLARRACRTEYLDGTLKTR